MSRLQQGSDRRSRAEPIRPAERVVQLHLAGHTDCGTHCVDTHDGPVVDPVWELFCRAHARFGDVSTLLEWDARIPEFDVVHQAVLEAPRRLAQRMVSTHPTIVAPAASSSVPHPLHLPTVEVV